MSRREEQSVYIRARAKLQNLGVPCSTMRTMIVQRVANFMLREVPADPIAMMEEFIKPAPMVNKIHRPAYVVPLAMKIAAEKAKFQTPLIAISGRKDYVRLF